jgi:hypothetical protein
VRGAIVLFIVVAAWVTVYAAPPATASGCIKVGLDGVSADCPMGWGEYQEASSSDDGNTWAVTLQCDNGGICAAEVVCIEDGQSGFMHDVYLNGADVGDVCVPNNEVQEVDIVKLVIREFKRLKWPASKLVVQPRGGKTLVNFKTNFYTPDHRLIDQEVTVAGQPVTIRAVPVSYAWYFGDGTSTTTTSPGSPHPDLEITHEYAQVDEVAVRVDTTYAGEFRIGDGGWRSIPETLTVAGESQGLQIVEALPQLVLE